jgi:hypothetical protein
MNTNGGPGLTMEARFGNQIEAGRSSDTCHVDAISCATALTAG